MTKIKELAMAAADLRDDGQGLFAYADGSVTPGRVYHYRVRALRRVLDPADATGATKRDIASQSSDALFGQPYADGPLDPPQWTSAFYASGQAAFQWTNKDGYERITVLQRELGRPAWQPLGADLAGTATSATRPLAAGKAWEVKLKAYGIGRTAESETRVMET
jgi:hypothetical protein